MAPPLFAYVVLANCFCNVAMLNVNDVSKDSKISTSSEKVEVKADGMVRRVVREISQRVAESNLAVQDHVKDDQKEEEVLTEKVQASKIMKLVGRRRRKGLGKCSKEKCIKFCDCAREYGPDIRPCQRWADKCAGKGAGCQADGNDAPDCRSDITEDCKEAESHRRRRGGGMRACANKVMLYMTRNGLPSSYGSMEQRSTRSNENTSDSKSLQEDGPKLEQNALDASLDGKCN